MNDFIDAVEAKFPGIDFEFENHSDCVTAVGIECNRVLVFVSQNKDSKKWVVNVSPTFRHGDSLNHACERAGVTDKFWDMVYSN